MGNDTLKLGMRVAACAAALIACVPGGASGQPVWRPDRPVELIVPTSPGGNNDAMVRLVQKILQDRKLVTTPVLVQNKSGGNQHLAVVYLDQHAADPHYVMMTNPTIFTNELTGVSKQNYTHLTPLALMIVESNTFTVAADSPMRSMRDLIARLKADPESVSFAMPSRGGVTHLALAAAVKAAGLDPKRLKIVVFKTSGESITSLAGGHIDMMVSSLASVLGMAQAGKVRVLGIAARERRGGPAAGFPTLREQGIPTDGVASWRGLSGPPGLAPGQVAFWDAALARVFESADWKEYLAKNDLPPQYLPSREFARYLQGEYDATKAAMADIGLIK
jgi:putative tricarboxylic transport membrane protein